MTHQHPDGTLSDVLDDTIDPGVARVWQLHLTECAACRAELEQLRRVQQAARAWMPTHAGADRWAALKAAVITAQVTPSKAVGRPRRTTLAFVTAGTLAIAAMLVLTFTRQPAPAWPNHVLASATSVAALDTATRPLLGVMAPAARQEFTTLLADADASLREIETLRTAAVDTALLTDVYLQALDSKQRLLEGIRDYTQEGE